MKLEFSATTKEKQQTWSEQVFINLFIHRKAALSEFVAMMKPEETKAISFTFPFFFPSLRLRF